MAELLTPTGHCWQAARVTEPLEEPSHEYAVVVEGGLAGWGVPPPQAREPRRVVVLTHLSSPNTPPDVGQERFEGRPIRLNSLRRRPAG
ncbi:hypothetical protein D1872_300140 [compost metagenome]